MTAVALIDTAERRARLVARQLRMRAGSVASVADDLVGLHASDPVTVFLSLRARLAGFEPSGFEAAVYDERAVVRMLGMRRTMFVVPPGLAAVMDAACTRALAPAERRRLETAVAEQGLSAEPRVWLEEIAERVLDHLDVRGAATAVELTKAVPELGLKLVMATGKPYEAKVGISTRLLFLLAAEGRVVRARPLGTWLSSQYRWARTENWLGGPLDTWEPAAARTELVRRWLTTFGPGTLEDLKWWTGWPLGQTRAAIDAVSAVAVDLEDGGIGWVLPGDEAVGGDEPAAGAQPVLLPSLDPTTMGWKGRDWYLGSHRGELFDRNGNAGPTIWCAGRIVGGWAQRDDGEVAIEILDDVGTEVEASVVAEAERIQRWLGDVRFRTRFPTPLEQRLRS